MALAELKAAIAAEPANAGRTDAEVLAWLDEPVPGPVPASRLMSLLLVADAYADIAIAAETPGHTARRAAMNAVALLSDRDRQIDYANPLELGAVQATTAALVGGGVISAEVQAQVDGLGLTIQTRWAAYGLRRPTAHEIGLARLAP